MFNQTRVGPSGKKTDIAAGLIDVTDFGVVAGQDNGAALIALRDELISLDRFKLWTLYFPESDDVYDYNNNRWLYGLEKVRINGYGAKLRSTFGVYSAGDSTVFGRQDGMFNHKGDRNFQGGQSIIGGYNIDETAIGSRSFTCSTAAEAANFEVGGQALLHSFCQQYAGYSPNLRYFEWVDVTAVDAGTGVVTVEGRIKENHRNDYIDIAYDITPAFGQPGAQYFGKARALPLTNRPVNTGGPYYYHRFIEINGASMLKNENFPNNAHSFSMSSRVVLLNDVYLDGSYFPRESEYWKMVNCFGTNPIEPDKVLDTCIIENCEFLDKSATGADEVHAVKSGTGVNHMVIDSLKGSGRINVIAQKSLTIKGGNSISSSASNAAGIANAAYSAYNASWGGELVVIEGTNLKKQQPLQPLIATHEESSNAYTVAAVSGSTITVAYADNDSALPNIIEAARPGMPLYEDNNTTLIGYVSDVSSNVAEDAWEIDVDVVGTMPVVSDVIHWQPIHKLLVNGEVVAHPQTVT